MTKEEQIEEEKILDNISGKVTEKILPGITEKALEQVTKKVSDEIALRPNLFGNGDEKSNEKENLKKSAEFMKELATKGMTSGGSTTGAELVPTFLSDQFLAVAENVGLVRRKANKWPMQGMSEQIPTLGSVDAYRLSADGGKIGSRTPVTGVVTLASKTVGLIIPISKKLVRNSTPALVTALNYIMGKALSRLEDQWGLLGLTAGEGIFQTIGVPVVTLASGKNTFAEAEAEDLLELQDAVDPSYFEEGNMEYVLSRSQLNNFRKIRAAVGADKQGFLFEDFGGRLPSTLWDVPYSLSPLLPNNATSPQAATKFMALVNWDYVILGDEQKYEMEVLNQATITDSNGSTLINLAEQNMIALKITGDIEIKVTAPTKAHAILKTASS